MITCTFEDGGEALLRHAVVDTLILKDDKILLVKRTAKLLEGGKWGLAGGYVEQDETLKQAAEREVYEETGWKIRHVTLLTIIDKPDRPNEDRQNIAFVYFCTATEKTGEPDWESDEQRWFSLGDLPSEEQIAFDHYSNIKLYKKYLKKHFPLPYQQ